MVAGLFTSLFAFGNFLGPTVSGVLYDAIGFQYNMIVLQAKADANSNCCVVWELWMFLLVKPAPFNILKQCMQ